MSTIHSLKIEGKRWLDKPNGNVYHTVRAIINNDFAVTVNNMDYGYSDTYLQTILAELLKRNIISGIDVTTSLPRYCQENDITFSKTVKDVLKRDLKFNDSFYKEIYDLSEIDTEQAEQTQPEENNIGTLEDKTLFHLKREYILSCINCTFWNEHTKTAVDIDNMLTEKGRLQYLAQALYEDAFYEDNMKRFQGKKADVIADHIQGLPGYFNMAYNYSDILEIGNKWGYDLTNEKKEDKFTQNWFRMIANTLCQMFEKNGIHINKNIIGSPEYKIEFKHEQEKHEQILFYNTLAKLAGKDPSPRKVNSSGSPWEFEYWIPATENNINALKKIELFNFDTLQKANNKDHPDFGKKFCVFSAPSLGNITKKLEEISSDTNDIAAFLKENSSATPSSSTGPKLG